MADWSAVLAVAASLPETVESTSYGTPCLKVRGRLVVRLLEDEETLAVFVDPAERPALLDAAPDTFVLTPHYEPYPMVLVRLSAVDPEELRELVTESWRRRAPKRLVQGYDAGR